jgi:tryptophanyl-tRNA synthetase
VATLPGLDGRKMSKSYDNTIPLFAPPAELRKLIFSIVTDSRAPGEAKATEGSALFQLYQAFASAQEAEGMRAAFADGIGWGDAKQALFEVVDRQVAPMRDKYQSLIDQPIEIEAVLREGAIKARTITAPFIAELRQAVGLRDLCDLPAKSKSSGTVAGQPARQASFKQYRDSDGKFYFKLLDADGRQLLQSAGHTSARDVGVLIARLKHGVDGELRHEVALGLHLGSEFLGALSDDVGIGDVIEALATFAEAVG